MASSENRDDDLLAETQASPATEVVAAEDAVDSRASSPNDDASQKLLSLIKKSSKPKGTKASKAAAASETVAESTADSPPESAVESQPESISDTKTETIPEPQSEESIAARIAKDLSADFDASSFAPPAMPPPVVSPIKKMDPDLHQTLMDIPRFTGLDSIAEGQTAKQADKTPLPPAVSDFKCATACSSQWSKMSGTQQFRICKSCNLTIYDFTSMNRNQAQAMVFRREGKQNPVFYRRADGRFMTSDCPVGVKQRQVKIALLVAGVITVAGVILASIFMPPQPKTQPADSPPATADKTTTPAAPLTNQFAGPNNNNHKDQNSQANFSPWQSADLFNAQSSQGSLTTQNQFVSVPKEVLDSYLELKRTNNSTSAGYLPDPSASPTGRYVDVPKAVLDEYEQLRQSRPQSTNSATPSTPYSFQAPAQTGTPLPAAPSQSQPQAPSEQPGSSNSANPYIKNY